MVNRYYNFADCWKIKTSRNVQLEVWSEEGSLADLDSILF